VEARQQLFAYATDELCVVLDNDEKEDPKDNKSDIEEFEDTVDATREGSPFTKAFNEVVASVDSCFRLDDPSTSITNLSFSPGSFPTIRSQMFLYRFWSAALQTKVDRFAKDLPHDEESSDIRPICRSNAAVESHFRSAKKDRRNGGRSVRTKQFIDSELAFYWVN
jgi:hypothetical protein